MPQTRDAKGRWMQSVVAADTLRGDKVVNRQKEDLGTIEHFMIDVKKGRVAYAVLSFGGFLGARTACNGRYASEYRRFLTHLGEYPGSGVFL